MIESQELAQELAVKTRELYEFQQQAEKKEGGPTAEDKAEAIRRDAELNDIEDRRVKAAEYEGVGQKNRERYQALNTPVDPIGFGGGSGKPEEEQKSLAELLVGSKEYKFAISGAGNRRDVLVVLPDNFDATSIVGRKTLMTTSAGWSAPNPRTAIQIDSAQRRPVVADLIPQDPTNLSAIIYMVETTFTNNVAAVAEGGTKPESALALTPTTSNVRKIAGTLPVTEEQMDDVPGIQAYIQRRMSLQLALAEETELLTGDGSGAHLDGFLHRSGTQTDVVGGSEPVPTAVYRGINNIRAGGSTPAYAEPDGIVMHPNDWYSIATLQDGVGRYIWTDPFMGPGPERLWGKPVIVTPAETENTILIGDFGDYSHISRKMGATLRIYDQYSDYPVKNQLLVVVEERLSLEIYRPAAFFKLTGA